MSKNRIPVRLTRISVVAALVALSVVVPAAPAAAAGPTTIAELHLLLMSTPTGGTVTLDDDIIDPSAEVHIERSVTIDFNGHTISSAHATVFAGETLTVRGSGQWIANSTDYKPGILINQSHLVVDGPTITATGRLWNPGIGGYTLTGSLTLNSGVINATAGNYAAGVGGHMTYGAGGTVTVNGGTLNAQGGDYGPGIGGGYSNGTGAHVTVNGGTVTAISGGNGNGIGLAGPGTSGSLTIGAGAVVTAYGSGSWAIDGQTTVGGTLVIPAGQTHSVLVAPTTVTSTGKITGAGSIIGNPWVDGAVMTNNGIITNANVADINEGDNLTTLGRNYRLTFDANYGGAPSAGFLRLYATTLADGERTLPTPSRPGYVGLGWNTAADGSGTTITPTTVISGDLTLYAQWSTGGYVIEPANPTVTAGVAHAFSVRELANFATVDATADFTFSSSNPGDTFTGGTLTATEAGSRTITATKTSDPGTTVTVTATVIANAAAPAFVDITTPPTTVNQNGSITLTVDAEDIYGNPLPASAVTITSDQPTDVINGLTVTFPHASPHVLTARIGAVSDSVTIEVRPMRLANSGFESVLPAVAGGVMLLAGAALLYLRRRRVLVED